MKPVVPRGLYAVTPDCADTERLVAMVRAALAGGCALLQYRAKRAAPELMLAQARALAAACRAHGVPLIINDDAALAAAVGAAGVHLGRDDGAVSAARARLGPDALIGASCYDDPQAADRAAGAGADYLAFGSMYASATKPQAVRAPLELLRRARARHGVPVAAIGGITLANAAALRAAGADLLAVISDLFESGDIAARARSYAALYAPSNFPEA